MTFSKGRSLTHYILWGICFYALSIASFSLADTAPIRPFTIETQGQINHLELASRLTEYRQTNTQFANMQSTQRIINFDRQILQKLLQSRGFYRARIDYQTLDKQNIYKINEGRQFTISEINLNTPSPLPNDVLDGIGLHVGDGLDANTVLSSYSNLTNKIKASLCLFEVDLSYSVQLDEQQQQGRVTFTLKDTQYTTFLTPKITGIERTKDDYLRKLITFKNGECFQRQKIIDSRIALLQSDLTTLVTTQIEKTTDNQVQVTYNIQERKPKNVNAGLGYESNLGLKILLGWRHRNVFGRGEVLDFQSQVGKNKNVLRSEYRVPQFFRDDQTMVVHAEYNNENRASYRSDLIKSGVSLTRQLTPSVAMLGGATFEFSNIDDNFTIDNFALFSIPLGVNYNKTDNLINPKKGFSLTGRLQPFIDLYYTDTTFNKYSGTAKFYQTFEKLKFKPGIAARAAGGVITQIALGDVPAVHRFYSGGGGSIRGYSYQYAGDIINGDPTGGLAFNELSIEARLQFSENWGMVTFLDGGYSFSDRTESYWKKYLWGAGAGLRYYTDFAPFRFDIATPLNRRYNEQGQAIDDSIQIYIGIGQAF